MLQATPIRLVGLTPLLMNRYSGDEIQVKNFGALTEAEAWAYAREHAYLTDGSPVIPGENFQQALISGGKFVKGKGRGDLSRLVAAGMQTREHEFPLEAPPPALFRKMRKNPMTKGKMLNYRLRIDMPWFASATLLWDDALFQSQQVRDVVISAGIRVGLMDWRPEKRGPYGQFDVQFLEVKSHGKR